MTAGTDATLGAEHAQNMDERIVLNVGGIKYETYRSTLTAYPSTLLGTMFHPRNQALLHPTGGNQYFFDRNGVAFRYIMDFYRTGTLTWRPLLESSFSVAMPASSSARSPTTLSQSQVHGMTSPTSPPFSPTSHDNIPTTMSGTNNQPTQSTPPEQYYVTLAELEQELTYFQIPKPVHGIGVQLAHKAGGELLDDFAFALEELACCAIARLLDRISITFHRDGSPIDSVIDSPRLRQFSANGYCIMNHFFEDIKRYLESVFPQLFFKLEFGANYKSLTMSMSYLFTRNAIRVHSRIGRITPNITRNNENGVGSGNGHLPSLSSSSTSSSGSAS